MKAPVPAILCCALAVVSCDKAKSLVDQATTAVKAKIAAASGSSKAAESNNQTPADPELQKLVDQTAEGTIFRKDLPFPTRLEVRTTLRIEMAGRGTQSSAFGKQAAPLNGTRTTAIKLERDANQVRYTLEKSNSDVSAPASPEPEKKPAKPGQKAAPDLPPPPPSQPVTFRKTRKGWDADNRLDFRAVAVAKDLAPMFDQILIDNGLASRPLWFAKHRFKLGDQLVVDGKSLPMLVAGNANGSFTLKLESFEPVEGHPCGVFAVTGDYRRKQVPTFDGTFSDEDVTIQSGKIWLSLIYPVILKEDLDTIQTVKSGSQGGLVTRGQGTVKVLVTRAWKRLEP